MAKLQYRKNGSTVTKDSTNDQQSITKKNNGTKAETSSSIILQVIGPLIIAGFGMVGAGLLLDHIQSTIVFQKLSELVILVPALLGLKGNLEMTMASRLSSIGNTGKLKTNLQRFKTFYANMALTQCQSIGVGISAALFAITIQAIYSGTLSLSNVMVLCAISQLTACIASLVLGTIVQLIIILCLDRGINPDNIATPIAAALGDLVTLYILYFVSNQIYISMDTNPCLSFLILLFSITLFPIFWKISLCDPFTAIALYESWIPVLSAMAISSSGGLVLNYAISQYNRLAVFQPLINGVGGNIAAIQASRMSTFLHQSKKKSIKIKYFLNPFGLFVRPGNNSRTARILLGLVVPCQMIFLMALCFIHDDKQSPLTLRFVIFYLLVSLLQVLILLHLTENLVKWIWSCGINPDNSTIPYLTAIGDFLGTYFLLKAFQYAS